MPIVYHKEIGSTIKLAVWHIVESTEDLMKMISPEDDKAFPHRLLEKKKQEILATRIVIRQLVESNGGVYHGIHKDEHGKPFLNEVEGSHISISHAYPYAAAIIDTQQSTGIDLESPREQIQRIKHKFLSDQEVSETDINKLTILWAAKECLYKIYGRRQLIFKKHLAVTFSEPDLLSAEIEIEDYAEQFALAVDRIDSHWVVYKTHGLR